MRWLIEEATALDRIHHRNPRVESVSTNRKAIFALAIGEAYREQWETSCRANWEEYGRRNDYDIVVVDQPIRLLHDVSRWPLHW